MSKSTAVPVSYDEYYYNNFILAWDLSHAKDNGWLPQHTENGNIEINLKVADDTEQRTMMAIVMMSFDAVINFEGNEATLEQVKI